MKQALVEKIESRFLSYSEILDSCSEEMLHAKLTVTKTKSLADHFWCVIGARESYTIAIKSGKWSGFSCSINKLNKNKLNFALKTSASSVLAVIDDISDCDDTRVALLLSLNEHEVMHEGQIIRHMYGLGFDIPSSVKWA